MAFRDLGEFLEEQTLTLPIRGKEYTFPPISGRRWLKLQRLGPEIGRAVKAEVSGQEYDIDAELVTDEDEQALLNDLCGDQLKAMLDDGVTGGELKLVLATLIVFHLMDRKAAEAVWNAQGEAAAPNRAERREVAAKSARSRGSHASSTTPPKKRQTKASKPSLANASPSQGGG